MDDNRELDRAIAEKFLGWRLYNNWWVNGTTLIAVSDFRPTKKPSSCETVLDEIERRGWLWIWNRILGGGAGFEIITEAGKTFFAIDHNRYRAMCEAVMGAIEGDDE
jgi:hypothetical protein